MAKPFRAGLTTRDNRRFGLQVGGAFLALGLVALWRGGSISVAALAIVGAGLIVAAATIPDRLGVVQRAWMSLGHLLSRFTTPIVMGVLYFGIVMPIGLVRRAISGSPLKHPEVNNSYWKARTEGRRSSSLERQF